MSQPFVRNEIAIQAVRSDQTPILEQDRVVLRSELTWHFEGPAERIGPLRAALGRLAEPFGVANLRVNFGNAVGQLQLPSLGLVEIRSGKWSADHFEWMLRDLMTVASALPFAAGASSALPYDRSIAAREEILYHAFVYLRHILSETAPHEDRLLPSLTAILRDPHRRFTRTTVERPLETAREIHPRDLPGLISPSAQLTRVTHGPAAGLALTRSLRGYLPRYVPQSEVTSSLDTPENRFVKSFLAFAEGILDGVRAAIPRSSLAAAFRARTLAECDDLARRLRPVSQAALWSEVGQMVHFPSSSTVLQRRSGYRDVYRHFVRLRQAARVPLSPTTIRDLLETKDIALLYELWTYFAMVRELEGLLGSPDTAQGVRPGDFQVTAYCDLCVAWKQLATLYYNPSFSRNRPKPRDSYSVGLRPDIGLEIHAGPAKGLHLFDAKFKIDRLDAVLPADDAEEDEATAREERSGTFKRADLYKMHTYRDAIPEARSARVLYPGDVQRFFPEPLPSTTSASAPPEPWLDGVGATPLVPRDDPNNPAASHVLLTELLRSLCPEGSSQASPNDPS